MTNSDRIQSRRREIVEPRYFSSGGSYGSDGRPLSCSVTVRRCNWNFVDHLPFAVFGTKPLLRELISEVRETNALLANMTDRGKALSAAKKRRDAEQPIAY